MKRGWILLNTGKTTIIVDIGDVVCVLVPDSSCGHPTIVDILEHSNTGITGNNDISMTIIVNISNNGILYPSG